MCDDTETQPDSVGLPVEGDSDMVEDQPVGVQPDDVNNAEEVDVVSDED